MISLRVIRRPLFTTRIFASPYSPDVTNRILSNVTVRSTTDQLLFASRRFIEELQGLESNEKRSLLLDLGRKAGVDHDAIENAVKKYRKNSVYYSDVRSAATPLFHSLLQAVGNLPGGINQICNLRAFVLEQLRDKTSNSADLSILRRFEESCRELLTTWFALSNLQLNRLTWESPADIVQKVAEYEAVHPVSGLVDIRRRVGPHRRCFYFLHGAMPREPLVIVHVALTDYIADNVQKITKEQKLDYDEGTNNTAIYYSITSTQKGLSGIDLGNLLIKSVVSKLSRSDPHIRTHSTLSPIPGFRTWLLRALREPSNFGSVIDEFSLRELSKAYAGGAVTEASATEQLINGLSSTRTHTDLDRIEPLRPLLLHLCARYLYEEKRNGYAINPVANFHLRNGAQLYRLNWRGDTSVRGITNSFGMMVNYRYRLENVNENSSSYVNHNKIAVHENVLDLL